MRNNPVVREALARFAENEIILANKLYNQKLHQAISMQAYYKALQRMCAAGQLVNIAKGAYHLPKVGKYGIVPPSEQEIVKAFTVGETGTIVGASLYNLLHLTTQVPKTITVLSSSIEGATKSIRNVAIHYVPLCFTPEVVAMVQGLDVLENFYKIQDLNKAAFLCYTEKLASAYSEEALHKVLRARRYKKSTLSFLREILNFYHVSNNLNVHLSGLSRYKHPEMGELYATTRVSK